jgi:uncharacterized protein YutE (UPF0331/DUF86 family)
MVDEAVDINILIITDSNKSVPDYNQSTFDSVSELKIIPETLSKHISGSVGLRNKLVHRYDMVQRKIFIQEVSRYVGLYKELLSILISKYVSNMR